MYAKMKDMVNFGTFVIIVIIVSFVFYAGYGLGSHDATENQQDITSLNQAQFWELQDLQQNLSVCEWELGVKHSIVLDAIVFEAMLK